MVKKIIQKRSKKSTTVEAFHELQESNKTRKKEDLGKTFFIDISRRHKFKRVSEKLHEIQINLVEKIEEIKIVPYSYEKDNIGK